jgi:biotin carboxyl carrier protein
MSATSVAGPELVFDITLGDTVHHVKVRRLSGGPRGDARYRVIFVTEEGEQERELDLTRPEAGVLSMMLEGRSVEAGVVPLDDSFLVDLKGASAELEVVDPRRKALAMAQGSGAGSLKTQMPGRIVRILAEEGATVSKGDPVVVVEAMKMENELKAPADGTISRIHVAPGDLVEARTVLIDFA